MARRSDPRVKEDRRLIELRDGGRTGHVTVIVSSNTAYFRGDAFVLVHRLGLHADAAAKYANRWILVPHSDPYYGKVAEDVTLGSVIDSLRPSGRPRVVSERAMRGHRAARPGRLLPPPPPR